MSEEQVCCEHGNNVWFESHKTRILPVHINTVGYLLAFAAFKYTGMFLATRFDLPDDSIVEGLVLGIWGLGYLILSLVVVLSLLWNFSVWIQNTIVGHRLYRFRDSLGSIHLHKVLPQYWLRNDGDMTELVRGRYHARLEPIDSVHAVGPILQVRQGGIFRQNRILGYPWRDLWKIKSCWDGQTVVLEDRNRMVFGGPGMEEEELFTTLERHQSVRQISVGYDILGQDVCIVLDRIRKKNETMGNSPHVRAIRRFLDHSMDHLPEPLRQSWQRFVNNSEMLVHRRWDVLSAKSEREDSSKDNSAIS